LLKLKTTADERLDGIDAERFSDMLHSHAFAILWKRVLAETERSRTDCTAMTELPEVYRAQGAVAALRSVLAMPETILAEMRTKKST